MKILSSGCGDTFLTALPRTYGSISETVEKQLTDFAESVESIVRSGSVSSPYYRDTTDDTDLENVGRFIFAVVSDCNNHPLVRTILEHFGFRCQRKVINSAHPVSESGYIRFYFLDTTRYHSFNPNKQSIPKTKDILKELGLLKE